MSSADEDLHSRLLQLQSRFTWDLREEDLKLDDLTRQLNHDIDKQLGQRGALANSYSFLAYVRYLQNQPDEVLSLLQKSEQETRKCYGEDNDLRLVVIYGDLAWLKYHTGDHEESQEYCQRVEDILAKNRTASPTVLHPEVYGEKGWTFLKFSKSYYPKADECFTEGLKLQPDDCELNNGYAIVLYRTEDEANQSQNVSEPDSEESPATQQLRKAVGINPTDGVLLSMLALKLLHYNNNHSEADDLVKRALEVGADDSQVTRYVAKYLRNERWRNLIIQHLEKALELKSTLNQAKALLALQYAEKHQKTGCSCSPNDCRELQRVQGMFDEVLEGLDDDEHQSIRQSICRYYAECCHYHTIKKDLAVTYYLKALDLSTSQSEKNLCAKKVKQIAERRLKRDPSDAAAYGFLGAVARAKGHHGRAVRYYESALEHDRGNAEYLAALCELRLDLEDSSD